MFVSYRHSDSPNRFFQEKSSVLPQWAVDIKDEEYMPNWAGLSPHPTDEYVHWNEKNPQEKMLKLREAWEAIDAASCVPQALLLLREAMSTASLDEAYNHQDFSLGKN